MNTIKNIDEGTNLISANQIITTTISEGIRLPEISCINGLLPVTSKTSFDWYSNLEPSKKLVLLKVFNSTYINSLNPLTLFLCNLAEKYPNLVLTSSSMDFLKNLRDTLNETGHNVSVAPKINTFESDILTANPQRNKLEYILNELENGKKIIAEWNNIHVLHKPYFLNLFIRETINRRLDSNVYFCANDPTDVRQYLNREKYLK